MRLAQHDDVKVFEVGDLLAVQLVGRAAVVLAVARGHGDVVARLADRLAGVAGFELRKFFMPRQDQRRHLQQDPAALGGCHAAPRAV